MSKTGPIDIEVSLYVASLFHILPHLPHRRDCVLGPRTWHGAITPELSMSDARVRRPALTTIPSRPCVYPVLSASALFDRHHREVHHNISCFHVAWFVSSPDQGRGGDNVAGARGRLQALLRGLAQPVFPLWRYIIIPSHVYLYASSPCLLHLLTSFPSPFHLFQSPHPLFLSSIAVILYPSTSVPRT